MLSSLHKSSNRSAFAVTVENTEDLLVKVAALTIQFLKASLNHSTAY